MTRALALSPVAAAVCLVTLASPAAAQIGARTQPQLVARVAAVSQGEVRGVILDDGGGPLVGAVVSAVGSTSAFAVTDAKGRFVFRNLPFGPYLVRAHLKGYVSPQARIIQVDRASLDVAAIALASGETAEQPPRVLAAGVGTAGIDQPAAAGTGDTEIDQSEISWRLRHLKRSVLKDENGLIDLAVAEDGAGIDDSFLLIGRAMGNSARMATALFSEIPFSGEVNLLTSASFNRPQDLFSSANRMPRGIAFLSLEAPSAGGDWAVRGALTQGDLASWIIAASYLRNPTASHQFEAGMSYGMQRYLGGNANALAAVVDGARNVGTLYAYDRWTATPQVSVGYGAKYARYDYLSEQNLWSPRAHIVLTPSDNQSFKVRASASRRAMAPGAEEFIPPSTGLWLPPERTFSPLSTRSTFTPEHVDHFEVAAERQWIGDVLIGVRAFRQDVDDQIITVFGVTRPGRAESNVGHYYVTSGGDVSALGWGLSVSRPVGEGIRASIDYTNINAQWSGRGRGEQMLEQVAPSALRRDVERLHDFTTSVESVVPVTATRVYVVYKFNTAFADADGAEGAPAMRFDVQLKQALPFLNFSTAQWEMLVAVRNMFREELLDASVYDELLVVRPPKRVVGGVTVRF
jgi:hypothetical protein